MLLGIAHLQKVLMHSSAFKGIQLRVKGQRQLLAILGSNDFAIDLGKDLYIRANLLNIRRADEGHGNGAQSTKVRMGTEAAQLTPVGIATHGDGHGGKMHLVVIAELFCQQNHPGTGGQNWHACYDFGSQCIVHPQIMQQLALHRALASWQHQSSQ